jgi:type I restriction enzyme S subunit
MEVKKGYKQTEVGVIPEDWGIITAADACTKIQDGTHFSPKLGGNDYLYITSKNIRFGFLDISSAERITELQHRMIYRRCDVKNGDLLLTKDGANTGNAALNSLDEEFSLLSSVAFLRFATQKYLAGYFLQQILSYQGQKHIQDAMTGNAITRLTLEKINKLCFPLPPTKAEQTAIAAALSDADALIQSLEKLIAKKRLIKQGAMQELLKPREGWVVKKLGEIAAIITTGKLDANAMVENGEYRFYTCAKEFYRIDHFAFNAEALLVSGNGANVGYIHYYKGKFNAYQRTYVLTDFSENIFYVKLYMDSYLKNRIVAEVNAGNTPYIKMDTLTDMIIYIPKQKEEQTHIVTILADMDAEISAMETKLAKYKQIKQGMMQNLLTGKIRLV